MTNRENTPPQTPLRLDLYDADTFMADGDDTPMTASESVLAWLLIEKIGVPDDVGYSPNQAQEIIVRRLDQARELDRIDDMLNEGVGDDTGNPIMPEFAKGLSTYGKIGACLHLLEKRRDALALAASPKTPLLPQDVVNLVVAAREFWDIHNDLSDESGALDKALEAFSSRVPYADEPAAEPYPLTTGERSLLEWLAKEDSSALGECEGGDLVHLEQMGLVAIQPIEGRHRHYSRVSVTEPGMAALATEGSANG